MLTLRELLLLQLLSVCTSSLRGALTDPQQVTAPEGGPGQAKEIKPLWFDYPDSEKEQILAVYKLIGEEPVFVTPSTFPQQLRFILVGAVLLLLLFFLYQICSKVIGNKG